MSRGFSDKFRILLNKAVREIAFTSQKSIRAVQDELGQALGRSSGSCIDYWKRGHVPAAIADVELLAQLVTKSRGLSVDEARQFVLSADPYYSVQRLNQLLPLEANGRFAPINSYSTASQIQSDQRVNPFVVGPPITRPSQFFGRELELQRIFGWWQLWPLQNIAIIGRKRSGKTSLLNYLRLIHHTPRQELRNSQRNDWLPQAERFHWIYIDFQDPRMTRLDRLLSHILSSLGIDVPEKCSLEQFMDCMSGRIVNPTIILMDELIAGLESPELDAAFWWALRALVSHTSNGNLGFALTAHDFPMHLALAQGKPSPFFNLFSTLELGPMSETAAYELIASSPQTFPEIDAAWIVSESGCWPALVQILCQVRLEALEGRLSEARWRQEGLHQIARFAYLLNG